MKRTWNLAPVLQIVQKIPENYCPCLYLSIGQVWWLNELWLKRYLKMYPVSCTNTHHDVTDLVNHGMVKNTKTWISWEWNITFLRNKKILSMCLKWHILRSYGFVVEVTFEDEVYFHSLWEYFHTHRSRFCFMSNWKNKIRNFVVLLHLELVTISRWLKL